MVKLKFMDHGWVTMSIRVSRLGLVRVLKYVYGSQLAQPRPGVNPPSTIPIDFLIPIPVNLAMIPNRFRFQ